MPAPDAAPECPPRPAAQHAVECMVCGAALRYQEVAQLATCHLCGSEQPTQTLCLEGHFICDTCHAGDALAVLHRLCEASQERDMVALMARIRRHPTFHVHGPEHHAMVPAVIVAAYRNSGGELPPQALHKAIQRGAKVPGGFCGFAGSCGAALGVGIGFSVLLEASPVTPRRRQLALASVSKALARVAAQPGARCCQRDCWIALRSAAQQSRDLLPVALTADAPLRCAQSALNKQCVAAACPLNEQHTE